MAENGSFWAKKGRVGRVNFNLYHYAGNNPVKYVDPDGRNVKNPNSEYYVARTEDNVTVNVNGEKIEIHNLVLAPGDKARGGFDGVMDKNGNAVKVTADIIRLNFSFYEDKDGKLKLVFTDSISKSLNDFGDKIKKILNEKFDGDYDYSSIVTEYQKQIADDAPLNSWWNRVTNKEKYPNEPGSPDNWETAYNSDVQKALREKLKVENEK